MSRHAYDALRADHEQLWLRLQEVGRNGEAAWQLVAKMKRDGFTAPITEPVYPLGPLPQPEDLPNPVLDALDEIGLTGAQLEQHKDWARRRLRREKNAEIVAEELLAGGLVMEEQAE